MKETNRPRLLLADDHRVVAEGVRALLADEFDLVGIVDDGIALVEEARTLKPDVVVTDISMPRLNGIDALVRLKKENPAVRVVFLTMHQELAYVRRALDAGASGFVLKHSAPAELVTAIRAVLEGETWVTPVLAEQLRERGPGPGAGADPLSELTPRQREVLQLLAEGYTAKQIAATLRISTRTVEFHKYNLMEVLGASTNAELVQFAIRNGLLPS